MNKAMFTLYRITLAPARKPYRVRLLFTHKNDDFSAISVTEGSCAPPISKLADRFCSKLRCSARVKCIRSVAEVNR